MSDAPPPGSESPPPSGKQAETGDATGGVIPYKNVPALIAYYCGVFSLIALIPCFFPLPIAAFVLGLYGLKRAKAEPAVRGQVHAWIGIVAGAIFGLWSIAGMVIMLFAFLTKR